MVLISRVVMAAAVAGVAEALREIRYLTGRAVTDAGPTGAGLTAPGRTPAGRAASG